MKSHHAYAAALVCFGSLFILLLSWLTVIAPPPPAWIAPSLLLLLGPMLLPLRGLLHGRRYTFAWSTLLILLYFAHGVVAAANGGTLAWLGAAEVILSLGYFVLAIIYLKRSRPPQRADEGGAA